MPVKKPYTSSLRSTTATEFVPDFIINAKREFKPMVIKQIGRSTGTQTQDPRIKSPML